MNIPNVAGADVLVSNFNSTVASSTVLKNHTKGIEDTYTVNELIYTLALLSVSTMLQHRSITINILNEEDDSIICIPITSEPFFVSNAIRSKKISISSIEFYPSESEDYLDAWVFVATAAPL